MSKLYNFEAKVSDQETKSLKDFEGKVLLLVNTATECGFTPQYEDLQKMYDKYQEKGFEILDFPCNQFGNQAPGSQNEIHQFCTSRFGVTFPIFDKVEVNGENESPIFTYLKEEQGFKGFNPASPLASTIDDILSKQDPDYAKKPDIKWNFTKFLVDRQGNVVGRFEPTDDMGDLEKKVAELL